MVKMAGQPHYNLAEIQGLVALGAVEPANRSVYVELKKLDWTIGTLTQFILLLTTQNFHKAYPQMSIYNGRELLDADGYKMPFDEKRLCKGTEVDCVFFIKIGIRTKPSGGCAAVVSVHLDR
ncbi:hypothetical protein GHT07_21145 [Caenimonas koreensis DSM 17982]|uniref:Uncharacterized protein n=1 Tax=Caenimonas koreensis DSM 17982 TaxID=1121255 RepID=A0A844B9H0_9BURK|nr:hypothetical protein [Caenimonas koreensis]MRD49783.1 hypothetical protein [Caenimonas koreensis DSM 17982]